MHYVHAHAIRANMQATPPNPRWNIDQPALSAPRVVAAVACLWAAQF